MNRVEERHLDYGVVERRTYDENDRLVDVRKIYPRVDVKGVALMKRSPGSSGGHHF